MNFFTKKTTAFYISLMAVLISVITLPSCQKTITNVAAMSTEDAAEFNSRNTVAAISPAKQTARAGVTVSEHIHGFYEYLPKGYTGDTAKSYPLLICMHGIGQVGNGTTDLPGLLLYGPAMLINNGTFPTSFGVDGKTYSMIIITPQLTDVGMFPVDIDSLIEYCKATYRVDTSRVYTAGVSIGGACVWHYAGFSAKTAAKITAMVPICAWTTPDAGYQVTQQEAQTIASANIKIWQTHCYNDPTAAFPWSVSQANMVINSSPAPNPIPKLTCFNSDSHDAWTTTYSPNYRESGMNIYQWMLHYEKGKTSTPLRQKPLIGQVVTLKGFNNLYVHNDNNGTPLFLNSSTYGLQEGFVVTGVQGSKVALQNQAHYITKSNPSSVACLATAIGSNETFLWIYNTDGSVSFKGNNAKYISNNNGTLNCQAASIGPNEKFWINR